MSAKKLLQFSAVVYLLVAIVTYGDAVEHFRRQGEKEVAECKTSANNPDFCEMRRATGMAGAISSIVWPLYWSYRLQRSEK